MQIFCCIRIAALFFLLFLPTFVRAENRQILVEGDLGAALDHFSAPGNRSLSARPRNFRSVEPINISAQLPDGAEVQLQLNELVQRYWPAYYLSDLGMTSDLSEVTLYRGFARFDKNEVPLAGAIYLHSGSPVLFVEFASPGGEEYFHLQIPLKGGAAIEAVLETTRSVDLGSLGCGAEAELDMLESGHAVRALDAVTSPEIGIRSVRVLEIASEADFEFFSRYGSESNARIAAIINAANVIYQRDLNVDLQIKFQHTVTSGSQPYTSTTSGTLLNQFVDYSNSNSQLGAADVYHLFSGKDFDGSVIGTAYFNVVCAVPSLSYAVIQDIGQLTYLVYAHELGHNLGAAHDQGSPSSVMSPALTGAVSGFSSFSIGQMSAYIDHHGSCLATDPPSGGDGGTPPPPPPPPQPRSAAVTLGASFNPSTNIFLAAVSAQGAAAADCRAYLSMSTDVTMSGALTVGWGRTGSKSISGSSKNKKRISSAAGSLFVQAQYNCPSLGVYLASDTQSISVGNAANPKKIVAPGKWMKSTLKAAAANSRKRKNNS